MTGKVYKCQICSNRVKVLWQGRGGLSCCGLPLQPLREPEPPIDLMEVVSRGKSFWQLSGSGQGFPAQEARQAREGEVGGFVLG